MFISHLSSWKGVSSRFCSLSCNLIIIIIIIFKAFHILQNKQLLIPHPPCQQINKTSKSTYTPENIQYSDNINTDTYKNNSKKKNKLKRYLSRNKTPWGYQY